MIQKITSLCARHPYFLGSVFACFKMTSADFVAQKLIERRKMNELNYNRLGLFALFGFFYGGVWGHQIYGIIYPYVIDKMLKISHWNWKWKTLIQTFLDQTINAGLIYFPVFYTFKSIVYNGWNINLIKESIIDYFTINISRDMYELGRIFIPANIITFGFCPPNLRIYWVTLVSFVWTTVLSLIRGELELSSNKDNDNDNDKDNYSETSIDSDKIAHVIDVANAIGVDRVNINDTGINSNLNGALVNDEMK